MRLLEKSENWKDGTTMTPIDIGLVAAGMGYAVIEYWLGRTDKIEAGSALEVALKGIKGVLGVFIAKKK